MASQKSRRFNALNLQRGRSPRSCIRLVKLSCRIHVCTPRKEIIARANYTISGIASPIPHEYNATNNVLIDGTVKVRLYGDVNDDGKIDGKDIALVALHFGEANFP